MGVGRGSRLAGGRVDSSLLALDTVSDPFQRLRPYQRDGVAFLIRRDAALLADEMGLGKTVQAALALAICLRQDDCNRALVVTPASLRLNWERELERWAPHLATKRVQGSPEDREAYYLLPIPVLIASYEQVRSDMPSLANRISFDIVLIDEAQRIKNRHADTALACSLITRDRSWGLTGTPIENSPSDLVSVFRFLKPGLLYDGLTRSELHQRMKVHFLRRRKEEVLPELPPLLIQDVPLELQGEQWEAYETLWDSRVGLLRGEGVPISQTSMLALITKLKQLCNYDPVSDESVKLDYLRLLIDGLSEEKDKLVVFSQYVETLEWVSDQLTAVPHAVFHGGLSETARDRIIQDFELEPGPSVLLMSLRAGGLGLNLQSASTVLLFDRWWNPAVEDQAIHRSHRFGRKQPLHVIRFLVVDSIENRIAAVLAEKEAIIEAYTEQAESASIRGLSRDELRRMLDLPVREMDVVARSGE